jgi:hypothetical protein
MARDPLTHYSIRIQVAEQTTADDLTVTAEAVGALGEETLYLHATAWKTLRDQLINLGVRFAVPLWMTHLEYLDSELQTEKRLTGHLDAGALDGLKSIGFKARQ